MFCNSCLVMFAGFVVFCYPLMVCLMGHPGRTVVLHGAEMRRSPPRSPQVFLRFPQGPSPDHHKAPWANSCICMAQITIATHRSPQVATSHHKHPQITHKHPQITHRHPQIPTCGCLWVLVGESENSKIGKPRFTNKCPVNRRCALVASWQSLSLSLRQLSTLECLKSAVRTCCQLAVSIAFFQAGGWHQVIHLPLRTEQWRQYALSTRFHHF